MRSGAVAALTAVLLISACATRGTGDGGASGSGPLASGGDALQATVASYDLAAGEPQRLIVGLQTGSQRFVSFGEVGMRFSYLGRKQASGPPRPGPTARGEFLPIPGSPTKDLDRPQATPASRGHGVYGARVFFPRPGLWRVRVSARLSSGGPVSASAAFEVLPGHRRPAPGDPALSTPTPVLGGGDPAAAIDSRAQGGGSVPDPALHRVSLDESIAREEPALVVFATPVYCISQFCGPVTDLVASLARRYPDKANYIHVEIWRNYTKQIANRAAVRWLLRDGELLEPWVYLIGANGKIVARWDNVATAGEIAPYLARLPPLR